MKTYFQNLSTIPSGLWLALGITLIALPLSACSSMQDRQFANSLDCDALRDTQRESPTSRNTILDEFQSDDRNHSAKEANILNQSRSNERQSALRRAYSKKC